MRISFEDLFEQKDYILKRKPFEEFGKDRDGDDVPPAFGGDDVPHVAVEDNMSCAPFLHLFSGIRLRAAIYAPRRGVGPGLETALLDPSSSPDAPAVEEELIAFAAWYSFVLRLEPDSPPPLNS